MTTNRLSGLDTAFLCAETPTVLLHTMAVMILDPETVPGGYTFESFRDFIARRLPAVPPLRRRLCEVPFALACPVWADDPDLDVAYHVRRAAVPSPGGPRELSALAAEMDERPLDRSRPLWEMVVVEGLADGRIAVLAKLQHALMDGIAGMQFMAAFFGREPGVEEPDAAALEAPERLPGDLELLAGAIPSLLFQPVRLARAGSKTLFSLLRSGIEGALGSEPAEPSTAVPQSVFNRHTSAHRRVAYVSVPLADVKAVSRAFGTTVNVVVLAMVSGALRRYLIPRGELPEEPLVSAVPASTHKQGDTRANAYTVFGMTLASDREDPAERLRAIHAEAEKKKEQQQGPGVDALAEWADVPSPFVFSLIARAYMALGIGERISPFFNVVVSNVPGPPMPLYFGGARLLGLHPLGPIFDGYTLNFTAISREDSLDIGLVACRERLPEIWEIASALPEALAELAASVQPVSHAQPAPSSASAGSAEREDASTRASG
jgi:WS/DGAT/MGAT family acyltransferase